MSFSFRPATADDYAFLYALHVAAMKEYVARTWGWDDAWQEQFFAEHFDPAAVSMIVVDGAVIGAIAVEWQTNAAFISSIEILPDYQGRGIGAAVIRGVIAEADARGLPVALRVLKINPAQRLYARLGFQRTGETPTHYLMRREKSS